MSIVEGLVADLTAQSAELDTLVAALDDAGWAQPTPAEGWSVAHQIAHLAWTDRVAALAATDPDAFGRVLDDAARNPTGFVDTAAEEGAADAPARILENWRSARSDLAEALGAVPEGVKIPWFGPPMSAASMATARLMETWAHGLDVADALDVTTVPTDRIRGVVHIGVRTRDFAYAVHGLTPPAAPFRYEITAPSGELWTWGPDDATDIVRGPAIDFCQLVTQRRSQADLDLEIIGTEATRWAGIAQAFAGPPGPGRPSTTADERPAER
ncbi:TIGR03084 family protein [Gordonia sp. SID5947]|uniref:TIGR03084 family metal-binding protein n=1 Tax=Gordonia sp. SID5947 TaxID=2690315 RepID=UPI0013707B88|nr:TIGR03084 family metal-binding protein [Gordonia sp. SID5947]MYR08681.1 TIGR03084 family protein [Gordonia sp. SID5947]